MRRFKREPYIGDVRIMELNYPSLIYRIEQYRVHRFLFFKWIGWDFVCFCSFYSTATETAGKLRQEWKDKLEIEQTDRELKRLKEIWYNGHE